MRFKYTLTVKQGHEFQNAFALETRAKVLPGWYRELAGLFVPLVIACICWMLARSFDQGFYIVSISVLAIWVWQKAIAYTSGLFWRRFYRSTNRGLQWETYFDENRMVNLGDGVEINFQLSKLTRVYELESFLWFEFGDIGRARIPFSAFESDQQRAEVRIKSSECLTSR